MITLRNILIALALVWSVPADAAVATIYADTGGCNTASATQCSGTTDSATASASGAGSTITCSAASGPAAAPGCIITGTGSAVGQISAIAVDGSQALFVNCATNAQQKIFFINAVDDATGAIGTTTTPTGCTAATSDWGIGGRYIWPSGATVNVIEGALRAGDTVQFNNTPATKTVTYFTSRTAGDSTTGCINIIGKAGVDHPLLNVTSGNVNVLTTSQANYCISNFELKGGGNTSAGILSISAAGASITDVKITQSNGGSGIAVVGGGGAIISRSQITAGVTGNGISIQTTPVSVFGNYIVGVGGDGINVSANNASVIVGNVISTPAGRGIFYSGASTTQGAVLTVNSNTIYGATLAGFEVTDADSRVVLFNNIIMNTNSANIVKWTAGNAQLVSIHGYNLFFSSSSGSLSGLTANGTELTSDPIFTNAGSGDFTLQSGSPAKATGFPGVLLGGNTGYLDMGTLQRQEVAGGSRCIGC